MSRPGPGQGQGQESFVQVHLAARDEQEGPVVTASGGTIVGEDYSRSITQTTPSDRKRQRRGSCSIPSSRRGSPSWGRLQFHHPGAAQIVCTYFDEKSLRVWCRLHTLRASTAASTTTRASTTPSVKSCSAVRIRATRGRCRVGSLPRPDALGGRGRERGRLAPPKSPKGQGGPGSVSITFA